MTGAWTSLRLAVLLSVHMAVPFGQLGLPHSMVAQCSKMEEGGAAKYLEVCAKKLLERQLFSIDQMTHRAHSVGRTSGGT